LWLLSVGRQTIPADWHVIDRLSKCRQETGRQALEWQTAEKLEHRPSEKAISRIKKYIQRTKTISKKADSDRQRKSGRQAAGSQMLG